jgi:hypothetical protein
MSRPHLPHLSVSDRFMGEIFAAFVAALHHGNHRPPAVPAAPVKDWNEWHWDPEGGDW